jgi:hypothetical protein
VRRGVPHPRARAACRRHGAIDDHRQGGDRHPTPAWPTASPVAASATTPAPTKPSSSTRSTAPW